MKATDEQIIDAFRNLKRPVFVSRQLGISRQAVHARLMRLRLEGVELPQAIKGRPSRKERNS